jgi:hypothetical protein
MSRFSPGFIYGGAGTIAGTQPTVVSQGAVSNATGQTSATPANASTSVVTGDLLLAVVAVTSDKSASLATSSSGWTMGGIVTQGNVTLGWAFGYAGTVAGNCTFTWTGSAAYVTRCTAFHNTRTSSPLGANTTNTGSSNFASAFGFTSTHGKSLDFVLTANQGINSDTTAVTGFTHVSQNTSTSISLNMSRENAAVDPVGASATAYTSKTPGGGLAWVMAQIEICSIAVP